MENENAMRQAEQEARTEFDKAIRSRRLSDKPTAPNYAGAYMYMGKNPATDEALFKHINTRQYLPSEITEQQRVKLSGRY